MRKPSICFVAPNNYALLSGRGDIRHIGGAEVQRALIARELARRGFRVSFVTLDHGQPDGIEHGGIKVFKTCACDDGLWALRFFHPRWTSLYAAMARADADIYYQRTAGAETGQVGLWCRWRKRRFVYAIANEPECDRRHGGFNRHWHERLLYWKGLMLADKVIAQTDIQRRMLAQYFAIDATVIPSCAVEPSTTTHAAQCRLSPTQPHILWIGRFAAHKRLDWLLALAYRCPMYQFDVIGGVNSPTRQVHRVVAHLRQLSNVKMHGIQPYSRMSEFYRRAALLVLTSAWEGYPNMFMESWAHGIPVVSTVDPDGVIRKNGLGRVASNIYELQTATESLVESSSYWSNCSAAARTFFVKNHSITATVNRYEDVLASLYGGGEDR